MSNWGSDLDDDFNFEDNPRTGGSDVSSGGAYDGSGGNRSNSEDDGGMRSLSAVRRILIGVFGVIFILLFIVVVIKLTGRHDKASNGTATSASSSSTSYVAKKVQEAKARDSSSSSSKSKFSDTEDDYDSDSSRVSSSDSDRVSRVDSEKSDRGSSRDSSDDSSLDSSSIVVNPTVDSDILSNTATVESIALYSENDLLADFKVKVKMGSTNLEFTESYDVAKDWVVGDKLKISYSKVKGIDRVVIRGVKHLGN